MEGGAEGWAWGNLLKHMAFSDMLAGEVYQAANQKYRVVRLRDMFILCMTEIGVWSVGEKSSMMAVVYNHQR